MQKLAAFLVISFVFLGILLFPPSINLKNSETYVQAKQEKASPLPSPIISPSPSPSPKPSKKPTSPTPTPASPDAVTYLMTALNNYRSSKGLAAVSKDPQSCNFAAIRAEQISKNFSHDGFIPPYTKYAEVVENIAQNSDYQKVMQDWINSSFHAANMEKNMTFGCIAKSGNFYVYEGWRP